MKTIGRFLLMALTLFLMALTKYPWKEALLISFRWDLMYLCVLLFINCISNGSGLGAFFSFVAMVGAGALFKYPPAIAAKIMLIIIGTFIVQCVIYILLKEEK